MALDPAVVAVWQIVIGIFMAAIIIIFTIWMILRLQRTHAFYRFGEAMSIGYAKLMTGKIYEGTIGSMPRDPGELASLSQELEDDKTKELARKAAQIQAKKNQIDQTIPPPTE